MDFEYHYTEEQEKFRTEVRDWIKANHDSKYKRPRGEEMEPEVFDYAREITKKLGAKGWLHPTYPKEYGGGSMSSDLGVIISEELDEADVPTATGNTLDLPTIAVWGTEEQKQKFLRGRLTGELLAFQNFTEPSAGSDLASLKSRAVKDGDDWIINGEKVFVSGSTGKGRVRKPDHLFTPAITDPNAPRHRNLGYFLVPGDAPGVTLQPQDLLGGRGQNQVYMDNVRVSAERLIGGETQGWQVAQSTLEIEHGGRGEPPQKNKLVRKFLGYAKQTGAGKDAHQRHSVIEAFIDTEIGRLIQTRNHWMSGARMEMTYHGSQNSLWRKEGNLRVADHYREVAGLQALLDDTDKQTAIGGELELFQRDSLVGAHPGGTIEVQKVIIARRIGVSRTRERAAPTPSTAGITTGS
jgi:alkylation response protein AidB-like acyl-CoA dehydrogenase